MRQVKKVMAVLLVIVLFVLVSIFFAGILRNRNLVMVQSETAVEALKAYPHPVPQSVEETQETEPPETEPPLPPETEPVPVETVPKVVYETVPLFYMSDYPDILYRAGTVATSGSNIASLAMVASYLTGNEYRPDELADYFANYIGNSIEWLDFASDQLQLPWKRALNFHVAKQALQEGKLVIVLLGDRSIFTQTQHFIVLTGLNEAGRIMVHDPYEPHYEQWNLKDGLVNGFRDASIVNGYLGAWIYDPAQMPEQPFIYEPAPNTDVFRYPGIELTAEDKQLMADLICMEAESEPFEGQQAIAEVILNRLAAGNFQSSIRGIVYAEGQFLSVDRLHLAKPTHIQYEAIDRALNGPYILPKDVVFFSTGKVNDNVWGTIGSHVFCYQS